MPLVSKAMQSLGAQIVGVDDEFGMPTAAKPAARVHAAEEVEAGVEITD